MALELIGNTREDRGSTLLGLFERLAPGEHLTFLAPDASQEALSALQRRHPGQFDWYPLEDGPGPWRILLVRKERAASPRRGVVEFMDKDHQRFAEMLWSVRDALAEGRYEDARIGNRHLSTGLRRHVRMEEELILPEMARALGSPRGPALLLRDQHLGIGAQLDLLDAECALIGGERGAAPSHLLERVDTLRRQLSEHMALEEEYVYPISDHLLTEEERHRLVRRCMALE